MKWLLKMVLPVLVLASCSEEGGSPAGISPVSTVESEEVAGHEMMVLGDKLENPYSLANVAEVMKGMYPTKGEIAATDLYVRFLPKTLEEFSRLESMGVEMVDYPMDRQILKDGDYYRDPSLSESQITWQYATVPEDFVFPADIVHEILESCFIPENMTATRGFDDVDWNAVEREAYKATGNEKMLAAETRSKASPEGKITIVDDKMSSKKTVGVAGVKVMVNTFIKLATAYTDENGKYEISKSFSARPHYRICFKNTKGFSIGLNLIVLPASISTLGKGEPEGMDVKVDTDSDDALFRRCAVNNAAYDYFDKCGSEGMTCPPTNLRFWILNIIKPSCAVMLHHGAMLDNNLVSNYLGVYKLIVRILAPDITIGSKGISKDYASLYSAAVHEMAHASHFIKAGTDYWSKFATYILSSFVTTGSCYGSGYGDNAGYCEVGEMWAYYIQNKFYEDRYGSYQGFGTSWWFYPQIFRTLESGGVKASDICSALSSSVTDRELLLGALKEACPDKSSVITKAFKKYSR